MLMKPRAPLPVMPTSLRTSLPRSQGGSALLESLIGMVVFMVGMLGMIAAQTSGNRVVMDAQFRVEAAAAADDLIARIKTTAPALRKTTFQTDGAGFASWKADRLTRGGRGLPGADALVSFDAVGGDARTVRIEVTWQPPGDRSRNTDGTWASQTTTHRHVTVVAIYE